MLIDEDDDDKDTIPRGLVSQRRALFGNGDYQPRIRAESVPPPTSSSSSSSSSAASLSSPSSSSKKRSRSYSRPTEIRIFRYGMDESSSNSNIIFEPKNSPEVKRITVTRHVTTHITEEPQIVIENARSSSTMTTERHLLHKKPPKRVYPIVTVKVSDLPPTFMKPEQVYEPPKDYLFDPIEIPIERTYRLNSIRTSSAKPCETVPEPHPRRMKGDLPQCDPEAMNGNDGGGYKQLDNWHQFEILKKKLSTDSYDNQRHVTPDEIAEECRRMLNELQDDEEKENRIVYGRSHGQVDEEIDKLKKQVAETSDMGVEMPPPTTVLNNKQEIPDRSIIPASDTSHIISLKDQSVMYTTGAVARQEALIIRLQKELTDAQRCNHALNSQLTSLKSKNESAVTKTELKERQKECDNLRKKVQKYEIDKQKWEDNLPVDVQLLIAQKKQLANQLNQEQNDKQEIFKQMNVYVAQLAEVSHGDSLREENKILKRKLQDQEAVTTAESQRLTNELQKVRMNADVDSTKLRMEHKNLQADFDKVTQELSMKTAALQSLKLAKQDTSKDEEYRRMSEETLALKDAMKKLEREKEEFLDEIERKKTEERILLRDKEDLQVELERLQDELKREAERSEIIDKERKNIEMKLIESKADIDNLSLKLSHHESNFLSAEQGKDEMIRSRDEQIKSLKENVAKLEAKRDELTDEKFILETTLINKDTTIDTTRVDLYAAQSKIAQVEDEKITLESQLKSSEREISQLLAQIGVFGAEDKEIDVLRLELKKANEHVNLLENRLQKASSQASTESFRQEIEELKNQNEKLKEERSLMDSLREEIKEQEEKINALTLSEKTAREKYQKLESELDDSKNSKVSVAEEIKTLMNSINSLRKQIDENNLDIGNLEKERNESRQFIEDLNEEMNAWKEQAEEAQAEKEQLERELKIKTENMNLLTSASSHNKSDYDNLLNEIEGLRELNNELEEELAKTRAEWSQISKKADTLEKAKEGYVQELQQLAYEKEESDEKFEQQLKHVQQDLLNQKKRIEELEEERVRAVGSSDSEKKRLLDEANEQREKASNAQSRISTLEEEVSSISGSLSLANVKNNNLESKLESLEIELEEALTRVDTSTVTEIKMQQFETQNNKLQEEITKLEKDLKETRENREMTVKLLEKQIEKLKSSHNLSEVEKQGMEEKMEESERMSRKIIELEAKLATSAEKQQQSLLSLKNMTELVEKESKRFQEAAQEKRRFKERAEEAERLLAEAKENPQQSDDVLITENARLASELMTTRSQHEEMLEDQREQVSKQYDEKIKNLTSQLATSSSRVEELNRTIVQTEKKRKDEVASVYDELQMVKNENARLQVRIDEMYNTNRLAPSRRVSNMSAITNFSTTDFSEIDDVDVLREQIDKQKRLIIVLRRKCQGLLGK